MLLVVDMAVLCYRCWHSASIKRFEFEEDTKDNFKDLLPLFSKTLLIQLSNVVSNIQNNYFLGDKVKTFLIWDGAEATKLRRSYFSDYKINRLAASDDRKFINRNSFFNSIREAFKNGSERLYIHHNLAEADDIIAVLLERLKKKFKVMLVTSDNDLWQLLRPNVIIYNPITKVFTSHVTFKKSYRTKKGYSLRPKDLPLLKALMGDPSDNYHGVSGVGRINGLKIIEELGKDKTIEKYNIAEMVDVATTPFKLLNISEIVGLIKGLDRKASIKWEAVCNNLKVGSFDLVEELKCLN